VPERWDPFSVWMPPGSRREQSLRLSNQLVRLVRRYAGRGATQCRTTINTEWVVVVLWDFLTTAERTLVDAGQTEAVKGMWRLGDLMAEEATRLVEQELGIAVTAYLNDCDPEANCAMLMFVLDSPPENGHVETEDR
jgi:uncharacterized protein YbcI